MAFIHSFFGRRRSDLIGLDIGSNAVKLLTLSRRGTHYTVDAMAIEPLPPGAVQDGQILDPAIVAEPIRRAHARSGTHVRDVAMAVPASQTNTKLIGMPASLREQDMEAQIKAEADQYIPYPIEEVNLDFQALGSTHGDESTVDVLLVACRKEQVEQRAAAVELAGLIPKVMDVETYALESSCELLAGQLPDGGQGKTIAIVDIGANTTSILVLDNLNVIYTRDQAFGGMQLTEEIMHRYGMDMAEASRAKLAGELPEDFAGDVLPRFYDDLAQQIDRSFQFFFASSSHRGTVDHVILAGGGARLAGAAEAVQERLQIPTELAKPFTGMSVSARARRQKPLDEGPMMLIAAGLALRAFDGASTD